jgi:hypothetical protein
LLPPAWRYDASVPESDNWDAPPEPVPRLPLPPYQTRIELAAWAVYAVVAVLLLVIPLATHSFGLPDVAAWVLLVGAVGMTAFWLRNGALRGPEWLSPEDYERYLKAIQRIPGADEDKPSPPKPTARLAGPRRSGGPPPPP